MDDDRRTLVRCLDLTALGEEDDASIEELCARATRPVPADPALHVAAVCVWPRFVPLARQALAGTEVRVATATGGFPDPASLGRDTRVREITAAVTLGADEVDVVVDRSMLADPAALADELAETRVAASGVVWKAILETGALDPAAIAALARMAIDAGADFLKTSTGKGSPGADPNSVELLAGIIGGSGRPVGLKVSGGVRTARDALGYLAIVRRVLGRARSAPERFRIGASSLLDELVRNVA
jgi:deoxyribose-phosphate aldolase